ncbi:MAG TPA: CHAT domain-containing tetratricopeptide repeat protein [Streptosporangiaceae bacterium]|nr:CHAT domain-containing tetratricopeptide repeat protein [Streptosporangiaceae bacterium]HLN69576.1 CHAT domain-containing tetratricopeptide repeat protein [Streptosporangiaceae bacterium]
MTGGGRAAAAGPREMDPLVALATSRPWAALTRARAVLAGRPGPHDASVAHQAAGIVLRDFGDVEAGVRELRQALRQARRTGSAERETDVLASLAVALVFTGRTAAGLAAFEAALRRSSGVLAAQVLYRRGIVFVRLGRFPAALEDARHAVVVLRRAGDPLWTARALNLRATVYQRLGSTSRADADYVAAIRLYSDIGQELEALAPMLNRALTAYASGDLPAALAYLDAATPSYQRLKVPTITLRVKRCTVLLAAGLAGDALAEAEAALGEIEEIHGQFTEKADLLLMAANCALAAAQPRAALDWAQAAYRMYRSQRSAWRQAHAARVLVQARYEVGPVSAPLLHEANRSAARLDTLGSSDAAQAHLLAGRIALDLGRRDDAERHLAALARTRRRGPALSRVSGWLGEALRAEAAGRPDRMLAACRRGLDVLDEYRLALGASELRAQATVHGAELAALAQRHAAQARRPRLLLTWSERWRATAYAVPPVRPSADPELNASLAALRMVTRGLDQARSQGMPSASLQKEQQRLETEVRASALRGRGNEPWTRAPFSPADLLDELGPAQLIEIVDIDGDLYVLACGSGRIRQFAAGRADDAMKAADFARFALRRLARSRPGDDLASQLAILDKAGPALQRALLEPALRHLGDGPVIIVPTGKLHPIPWAILPALKDRVISVAPSASAWMRAHQAPEPEHRHVTLARGPGLATDGAEVPLVARLYDDVTMLDDAAATADKVLSALDGAWLAHIAAHGIFRADSPLFSSLRMHDGPLTVYDFERLSRAPYRMVLSSCDSGVLAPAGANELLGLVSSLLPLGTAGVLAAIVQLNDRALVPLMVDLHCNLRAGQTLAESLYSVRLGLADDPVQHATAASLVALGAA